MKQKGILLLSIVLVFLIYLAAGYQTKVYRDQGGNRLVVDSTGILDIRNGGYFVFGDDTLAILKKGGNVGSSDSIIKVHMAGCDSTDIVLVTLNSRVQGKLMWAFPRVDTVDVKIDMNPADTVILSVQLWKD